MERKARKPDFALSFERLNFFYQFKGQYLFFPRSVHDHVDVVKVDNVRLQPFAGFVEETFEIFGALHDPPRGFRGDVHLITIAARQRLSGGHLALSAQINVTRVHIVQAVVNGMAHHADALRFVHGFAVGEHGQTQHTEAKS